MAKNNCAKWVDSDEIPNLPLPRYRANCKDNHRSRHHKAEDECPHEPPEETRKLFEECNILDFFGCGTPGHIYFEKVAEQGL